jgi:dihydrofolate synthase/folylpolyglutamate synthase
MNFEEALDYMQGLRVFGIKLGNERFLNLLARLGNPHLQYPVVHIAGTKGKGSTTALSAAILKEHGFNVGSYYSPYVFDVRERVQINGEMIPRDDFARLVTEIKPHADALAGTELGTTTEFELKTAVGFLYFAERKVDFAAIEVGLGGRLDATNVVSPVSTVITNIGLDHTHILGDTHAKIAFEKAGIIKPGIPCITATDNPEALDVIRRRSEESGAPLYEVIQNSASTDANAIHCKVTGYADDNRPEFSVTTQRREYFELRAGLLGSYQIANAGCAIGAVEEASVQRGFTMDCEAVRRAIATTTLPGRMQIARTNPTLLLDGAHNAIAAEALRAELCKMKYDQLVLVIGMVGGHEPAGVVNVLAPLASKVFATQPDWHKSIPVQEMAEAVRATNPNVETVTPPLEATRKALSEAGPNDLVLVTGSFYLVGEVNPEKLT